MPNSSDTLKITIPFEDFKNHLKLTDNYRIIFSGIFGIGKTTYLKNFFCDSENEKEYEAIHLFPVNYSVARNEDIFELVKFDILFQLLTKDVVFEKEIIPTDLTLANFVKENFIEVLTPFLNLIPAIGGTVSKVAEKLIKLQEEYKKYQKKSKKDELDEVSKFLNSFTMLKGSIYEEDFFTNLIQNLIAQLKGKGKEVILIIDDLDRIDPEHIFRLLNVFAAHVDINFENEKENKFDFNRVIFVCDIENIRNIYQHKYGIGTDFNGYIDKFYSRSIFKFDVENLILEYVTVFSSQLFEKVSVKIDQERLGRSFRFILSNMLLNSAINLRDLFRVYRKKDLVFPIYQLTNAGFPAISNSNLPILLLYDVLKLFSGNNINKIHRGINKCRSGNTYFAEQYNIESMISDVIVLLDKDNHKFNFRKNGEDEGKLKFEEIIYNIERYSSYGGTDYYKGNILNYEEIEGGLNYFNLLLQCFKIIDDKKIYQK